MLEAYVVSKSVVLTQQQFQTFQAGRWEQDKMTSAYENDDHDEHIVKCLLHKKHLIDYKICVKGKTEILQFLQIKKAQNFHRKVSGEVASVKKQHYRSNMDHPFVKSWKLFQNLFEICFP